MSKFLDLHGLTQFWTKIKTALNRIMVIGSASSISNDQVIFLVADCGTAGSIYNTGVTISYVNTNNGYACLLHATPRLVSGNSSTFSVNAYALTDTATRCPLKTVLWKDSSDNHYYIGFATTQRGNVSIGYTPIGAFASSFRTARIALSSITVIKEANPYVFCSKTQLDTAISTLDASVVHKSDAETITGIKTFNNDVSPRQAGDSFSKQSKVFVGSVITPYADWDVAQKDGNHFRLWTIDLTSVIATASTHCNVIVKLMGSYYNTPGNGTLQKEITFQINNGNVVISKGDYTVAQSPCADEFAISDVFKSGSSYLVQAVNRNPTTNNYPLRIEIDVFNRNASAVLDNVTLTESITEGLPSWAVDVAQVTASGSPVLTEATAATVAMTGNYSDLSDKPTFGTAAFKDVPASGDATNAQVVMGSDSRLTDSRTPKSHNHDDRYYTESETDTKLSGKLGTSGDGSSVTVTPDGTSTGTDIGSSTTLKAWAQKFKNLVSSLKSVAFSGAYSDLSGTPSIPDDSTIVHTTGNESIYGQKTFLNSAMELKSTDVGKIFTKLLVLWRGSGTTELYDNWPSAYKDGNHFRRWRIYLGAASSYESVRIRAQSAYYYRNSFLVIEKTLSLRGGTGLLSSAYTCVTQDECEFRISDLMYDSSVQKYHIDIVSSAPTSNNGLRPVLVEYMTMNENKSPADITADPNPTIIEGWPSWAGSINEYPRIQCNQQRVVLENDTVANADKALKVDARWFYHNEAAGNDDRWYKLLSVTHEANTRDYAGDIFAVTTRDAGDNNVQALLAFSPYAAGSDQTAYAKLVVLNMRTNSLGPVVFKLARPDNTHYTIYAMLPKFSGVKIAPVACDGAIVYESDSSTTEPSGLAPVDKMVNTYTSSAVGVGSSLQPTYVGPNGLVAPCSTLASFAAIHDIGSVTSGYGDTSLTPIIPDYIYCQEKTDLIRQYSLNIQRLIEGKVYKVMFGNGGNSVEVLLMNHYNNDNHGFTVHHGSGSTVVGYWDFPDGSHSSSYTSHIMRTGEHVYIIDGY